MLVVKRILKYLKGTLDFGLWYLMNTNLTLIAYTNAKWAGSIHDKKGTSGNAFFLVVYLI